MVDRAGDRLRQARAIAITPNRRKFRDWIGDNDLNDFYQINLKGRSSFNLALKGSQANVDVELIKDSNRNGLIDAGEVVATSRAPETQADTINLVGLAGGTYYIRVLPNAEDNTRYRLILSAEPTETVSFAYQVVQQTNAFRRRHGLPALAVNTQLTKAAQGHSQNMATKNFYGHGGLDGSTPWDRIKAAGYSYSYAAENVAAGQPTPSEVVQAWIDSPGHRAVMLKSTAQEIGVGYFSSDNSVYHDYWTQDFATPGETVDDDFWDTDLPFWTIDS